MLHDLPVERGLGKLPLGCRNQLLLPCDLALGVPPLLPIMLSHGGLQLSWRGWQARKKRRKTTRRRRMRLV